MIAKWKKMSPGDRLRTQVLIACGLVAIYAPFCLKSSDRYFESVKMLHRRQDRIEKRARLDPVAASGPNVRTMESRIAQAEEHLRETDRTFGRLDARFAPLDSIDAQQRLMLEISTLAERTGVRLQSISRKNSATDAKASSPSMPVDPALGRPVLEIVARARFAALFDFLNGLDGLSYHAAAMNLKLYARDPRAERGREAETAAGDLHVQLQLSL